MVHITYYVHGTTTDNENGLATGWLPGTLSEKGIEQGKALGTYHSGAPFYAIFCSDLQRAIDSADLGFRDTYGIQQDKRLREANYGDMNGKAHTFKDTMEDFIDTPFPNGESYRDTEERMRSFCEFLKTHYDGKHIAIVAHQAPQLALEVITNGKTWNQAIAEDWRKTKAWKPGWEYEIR